MPAPPDHHQEHQYYVIGMPPGHFRQIERHGHRVSVRQDQADEFAILRADAAKTWVYWRTLWVDTCGRQPEGSPSTGLDRFIPANTGL